MRSYNFFGSFVFAAFFLIGCGGGGGSSTTTTNSPEPVNLGPSVSTLAGTGTVGFIDGVGTSAKFNNPLGVAVDSGGNVLVADLFTIRKITPSGVVSIFAGSTVGSLDGVGTSAKFESPYGVAVDSSGNVFVGDYHVIRKITPAGVVSTIAGTGTSGFVNGNGTAASFSTVRSVAVDSSGNVFVADTYNHAIRKITPAGVVSTLAGTGTSGFVNGTGTAASFSTPFGVAVDSSGNVFVADTGNNAIRKITPAGVVSTFAGAVTSLSGFANGTGTEASFNTPSFIAVDGSGNVFVADTYNNAIRKITPSGIVSTYAGTGKRSFINGIGAVAGFNYPYGVAVDSSGNVFVADTFNYAIRKITP
jgi:streptogramin lyase